MLNGIIATEYFQNNNIHNVNKIIKDSSQNTYEEFNNGILILYEFINGKIDYSISYKKVINNLIEIYKLSPTDKLPLERFNEEKIINNFKNSINKAQDNNQLQKILGYYELQNNTDVNNFKKISLLINKNVRMFITHGDASVNVMKTSNGEYLIDWDEVMVAPLERDCWVFMNFKNKIEDINDILKSNGIDYKISYELLTYYAYKNYLIYITNIIEKYINFNNNEDLQELKELLDGWVRQRINSEIAINVLNINDDIKGGK